MDAIEKYTTTNHYVSALINQAKKRGIDADALLSESAIDPGVIDAPGARVRTGNLARLVQLMWGALQDENLGISRVPCKPGTFYMMGKLTVFQPNLEKALRLGFRFYDLMLDDYKLSLIVDKKRATLLLEQKDLERDADHLLTELILLAWHRYSSWLIGENLLLQEATFSYPPPEHVDEYRFLFPTLHRFEHANISFSFNRQYLSRAVVQNEASLKEFVSRCPVELFLRHRTDDSVTKQIRLLLEKKVNSGLPEMEEVAQRLNLTQQTLRRKLKAEGTSYQRIKDLVRRDVAIYHLTQQSVPVSEVAQLVGYSDPGVFVRAFKGWTGVTPGEYRHSVVA